MQVLLKYTFSVLPYLSNYFTVKLKYIDKSHILFLFSKNLIFCVRIDTKIYVKVAATYLRHNLLLKFVIVCTHMQLILCHFSKIMYISQDLKQYKVYRSVINVFL